MNKNEEGISGIVIVSNRLPITVAIKDKKISIHESVGGLATGLSAYLRSTTLDHIWVGWPGASVSHKLQAKLDSILAQRNLRCVPIKKDMMQEFYYGLCNRTLWPLFHYFPSHNIS